MRLASEGAEKVGRSRPGDAVPAEEEEGDEVAGDVEGVPEFGELGPEAGGGEGFHGEEDRGGHGVAWVGSSGEPVSVL